MSRQLPDPGTYNARRNAAIVIESTKEGALMAWVPYILVGAGINFSGKHNVVIGKKDGTPMQRNIDTLKKAFPAWTTPDFYDLETIPLPVESAEGEAEVVEFELQDCFHDDSYTKDGGSEPSIQFKVQWFNAPGGSNFMPAQASDDEKKKVRAKWLSKFKAIAASSGEKTTQTSQPAKTATPTKAPAKSQAATPPGRKSTGAVARTSTQEEVWTAICNANPEAAKPGEAQDDWSEKFYTAQDEVKPGANGELNPQEWGQVAEKLGY